MKKIPGFTSALSFASVSLTSSAATPSVTVTGGSHTPVSIEPDRQSGLSALYVVDASGGDQVTAVYTPATPGTPVTWSRFSSQGGANAIPIDNISGYTLADLEPDMGYIVTEGNRQTCFWVSDYASHPFAIDAVAISGADCSSVTLHPKGHGGRMVYYSINGRPLEIDREIALTYTSLEFDSESHSYRPVNVIAKLAYLRDEIHAAAPLTATSFAIEGDRFLAAWGLVSRAESNTIDPVAVDATVSVSQIPRDSADNEQTGGDASGGDMLGGSAPVEIDFEAVVTDGARFTEWQFASDPDFSSVDLRFSDSSMIYTFTESGTTYARFVAANGDGSCEYTGDPFVISIGESDLKCPNAFTPGNQDGVNDEWRVSYKSIIAFDCVIFARSGRRVAHLTDPSQGWDGRIGGKMAPSGVYYYIIKATGSDGRQYNLSGDINIIGYK